MKKEIRLGKAADLPEGSVKVFSADEHEIAVFNVDGQFYAIDNLCIHQHGPLSQGRVVGRTVICPWHEWQYDLTTGGLVSRPDVRVGCYPVSVRDEHLIITLNQR